MKAVLPTPSFTGLESVTALARIGSEVLCVPYLHLLEPQCFWVETLFWNVSPHTGQGVGTPGAAHLALRPSLMVLPQSGRQHLFEQNRRFDKGRPPVL